MKIIGITGASGSGKTTISQILNKREDTKIIDADKIAKEMTKPGTEYFLSIQKTFEKDNIFLEDGTLNRAKLAGLIYSNREKLEKLNSITFQHLIPKIVSEIRHVPANIKIIVIDAPLLFESGLDKYCDYTIALHVSQSLKVSRICKRDHIAERIAQDRLNIQKNNNFYIQKADYVIVNDENTTLQDLEERINKILQFRESKNFFFKE